MKTHVPHIHSTLRVVVTAFAIVCLLGLATIPLSSSAHAATNMHSTSVVAQTTTHAHNVAAQGAGTIHGCPLGYACIYPQDAGWNNDQPELMFYNYGTYQLYNQFGNHYIENNQTGGAWIWFCWDSYGNDCRWALGSPDGQAQTDFTPINSVRLTPY